MAHQKHRPEETGANGLDQTTAFTSQARKLTSSLSPVVRGYLILTAGLFLLLFSLGYFNFLKIVIGTIGIGLMIWGALQAHLIETMTQFIRKFTK